MKSESKNMSEISEISEENDEGIPCTINTFAQNERIRRIIEYQKDLYLSSSSSSSCSSSSASCSSYSSSKRSSRLLELMKGGSTSLGRLFDMEHTSLSDHFKDYSGSPMIKPILLWDSDTDHGFHGTKFWTDIKQIRQASDDLGEVDSHKGSFMEGKPGNLNKRTSFNKRSLMRTKSFRTLPRFGLWRCKGFKFKLGLKLRRLRAMICGRKFPITISRSSK